MYVLGEIPFFDNKALNLFQIQKLKDKNFFKDFFKVLFS